MRTKRFYLSSVKMQLHGSLCAIGVGVGVLVAFILVALVVYCIALRPTSTRKPAVTEEANRKLKERIQFLEVMIEEKRKERYETRNEDLDLHENGMFESGGRFQFNPSPPSLQSGVEREESEDEVLSTLNSGRFAADRLFVNFREKAGPDRPQENGLFNARAVPSEVISYKKQGTNRADARLPAEASLAYRNFLKLDPLNEPLVQSNLTPKGEHIHGPSIQGGERETIQMRQEETQSAEEVYEHIARAVAHKLADVVQHLVQHLIDPMHQKLAEQHKQQLEAVVWLTSISKVQEKHSAETKAGKQLMPHHSVAAVC